MPARTFEETVLPHLDAAFNYARWLTRNDPEAEDVVQDAFEKLLKNPGREVAEPKAYLARMVVNGSMDRLEARRKEREAYPGPWLPEPLMQERDEQATADILPYALLCLLEQLSPKERAVLLLREAFDHDYAQIAALCGIREDHCRQLLHRAKEKVQRPLKSPRSHEAEQQRLMQAFLQATFTGDLTTLSALLHRDIVLYTDGGGKASAARNPLHGAETVAKFFAGFGKRPEAATVTHSFASVNGAPALLLWQDGAIISAFMPDLEDGLVSTLYVMRNPDKIFFSGPVTK
jgi:RNA polymerase sigma-70 factor (ECF subfamily)